MSFAPDMAEIVALGSAQAQFMYSNQSIANSGANVKPSGPEVLVFTVSVGGEMTAIIKIACGAASEEASCIPLPPRRRKLHIRWLLLPFQTVTAALGHSLG